MKKTVLLIPAYKPSKSLITLLNEVIELDKDKLFESIVVINDGSGSEFDETFDTVKKIDGVNVLEHATNLGKGAGLKNGFNHILVNDPNVVSVITADADGQHAPEDIIKVAKASLQSPEALVVGCREFGEDVPFRSRFGNIVTRHVFRLFTRLNLSDTQSGLRAWPRLLCLQCLKITINGYDFEMESLIRANDASNEELELKQVPIQTIYEDGNACSHFNPVFDSMRIYFVFLRYVSSSIAAALIDNAAFMITYYNTQSIGYSQIAGRVVAMLTMFFFLKKLVFKSDVKWYVSLPKFVALVSVFGVLSYGAIDLLHESFGMGVIAAKLLAEFVLFITGFAVARSLIFK